MNIFLSIAISYLLGSLTAAHIISKYYLKMDITEAGSGNPGAANIYRAGGIIPASIVFLIDFSKGIAALYLSETILNLHGIYLIPACVFALLGHIVPLFGMVKGGKGVSTAAGLILYLDIYLFLSAFALYWTVFLLKKTSSIASLSAVTALCMFSLLKYFFFNTTPAVVFFSAIIMITIFVTHIANIRRIQKGTEPETIRKKENNL